MTTSGHEPRRITLEDLAALNREVAALVRSGLPLEPGLQQVARDFNGPTGKLASRLAEDLSAGRSLAEAVAARGDALPPVYRAVVAAGFRSGRLATALEGFADAATRIAGLRRSVLQAILYPLMVVSIAWVMFLLLAANTMPAYDLITNDNPFWGASLHLTQTAVWLLAAALPILLVLLTVAWWRATAAPLSGWRPGWLQRIPGGRRTNLLSSQANFAELLHLLLVSDVPMNEALPLAAQASGATSLEAPAAELAVRLERGDSLSAHLAALHRLPPLVRTALMVPSDSAGMFAGLRRASDAYRERAQSWVSDASVVMPVAITIGVGVGVVGMYGFLILQPYFATLRELSAWNWL